MSTSRIQVLTEEIHRLNEALLRFGDHKPNCWKLLKDEGACTCGYAYEFTCDYEYVFTYGYKIRET
jgi:hypothetical protein